MTDRLDDIAQAVSLHFRTRPTEDQRIGPDDELLLSGRLDSLGVMRVIAHLEQTFGITVPFPDMTIENLDTVRRMEAMVSRLEAASGKAGV